MSNELTNPKLKKLAQIANEQSEKGSKLVDRANKLFNKGLICYKQAGDALCKAKELVSHGQWYPWLEKNFDGSKETATLYMKIYREWEPRLKGAYKAGEIHSLTDARQLLLEKPIEEGLIEKGELQHADYVLHCLELVMPGISKREVVQQSNCFVFKDNRLITYNDEIACSVVSPLGITGAVPAEALIRILRQMVDDGDILEFDTQDGLLVIAGKRRKAGVRILSEIILPLENTEPPGKWKKLPDDFSDAIKLVHECAGKDDAAFHLTCVHLAPNWIEACSTRELARYTLDTGLKESVWVRQLAIYHLIEAGMTEFSLTENWIHFRSTLPESHGLQMSMRRYGLEYEADFDDEEEDDDCPKDRYPDLTRDIERSGKKVEFSKSLKRAVTEALVFTKLDGIGDMNGQILVEVMPGKVKVKGSGNYGFYEETRKLKYEGPIVKFIVDGKQFIQLLKQHDGEWSVSEGILRIETEELVYVASLSVPTDEAEIERVKALNEKNRKRKFKKITSEAV